MNYVNMEIYLKLLCLIIYSRKKIIIIEKNISYYVDH